MPDAARVDDKHTCPDPTPAAHVGGPIVAPCSPNVETNSKPQARATDKLDCVPVGLKNFIVTGSASVEINGKLAARKTDFTMHPPPGVIVEGSPTVEIGGPTAGATLGNSAAGTAACVAAAAGRASGSTQQSFGNCSLEAPRQLINTANHSSLTEQQMISWAQGPNSGMVDKTAVAAFPSEQATMLTNQGIPASQQAGTTDNLTQAVANDQGVTASLDAAPLWGGNTPAGAWHTVLVTGVQYDANGNPSNVIVNDTGRLPGTGNCGVVYSMANFRTALNAAPAGWGPSLVVTKNPVWP
jgi:uncharacterized Zn-binding protein involved in type VI secretion